MTLGERVRQLRERAGVSQQELATRAGLSMSILSQLERGSQDNPRLSTLKALAAELKVSIGQLIGEAPLPADTLPLSDE